MRRWVKIIGIVVASLATLVIVAAVGLYLLLSHYSTAEEKIGGNWIISRPASLMIEAGVRHTSLMRAQGRARKKVAEDPFPYRYLEDDCVVFAVRVKYENLIQAACGDGPKILVARPPELVNWDDLQHDPIRVNKRAIPWSEIKSHARLGESFPDELDKIE